MTQRTTTRPKLTNLRQHCLLIWVVFHVNTVRRESVILPRFAMKKIGKRYAVIRDLSWGDLQRLLPFEQSQEHAWDIGTRSP